MIRVLVEEEERLTRFTRVCILNELIDKELNSRVNLTDCRKQDHYFKTMSDRIDIKHIE